MVLTIFKYVYVNFNTIMILIQKTTKYIPLHDASNLKSTTMGHPAIRFASKKFPL